MLSPARAIGLAVGFAGVVVIVAGSGLAVADPAAALTAIGEVLLVALLYATAPFIIATKLAHVPSLGTITLSLLAVGVAYLLIAHGRPAAPAGQRRVTVGDGLASG